ncbi:alpha/beta hydrolase family protein [Angustibacter sp. McL0619]|uniref:alpha/beta hydrolase family protein n=1 Tax=Angustibacter sp. McL0619 TaxID=3415676 RepID=UPI003CEB3A0D
MSTHPGGDDRDVLDRPAPPPDLQVRYGPLAEHLADVRWPVGDTPAAALVVVVHGGFWRSEYDRSHTGPQCAGLAAAGFAVSAIEYRRTGQEGGGWPGTFEDVDAALRTVPGLVAAAAQQERRAVDVTRTVLLGHSAGGQLAAWAATRSYPGVVGAVSLSGVLDLALADALRLDDGPDGPAVHALLGGSRDQAPERYAASDPTRLGAPAIPVVAVHGDRDGIVPLELSRSYCAATGQRLVVLPGVGHFAPIDPFSGAWPQVLDAVRTLAS